MEWSGVLGWDGVGLSPVFENRSLAVRSLEALITCRTFRLSGITDGDPMRSALLPRHPTPPHPMLRQARPGHSPLIKGWCKYPSQSHIARCCQNDSRGAADLSIYCTLSFGDVVFQKQRNNMWRSSMRFRAL